MALPAKTETCPICGDPLPRATRDRRVSASGAVLCGRAECEERADDGCAAPGADGGPCDRPLYARRLCVGHYTQQLRHQELRPLRSGPARVRLSLRVSSAARERALSDPEGARAALERWARQ